ncbi:MAG: hypothetical protein KDJ37_03035 [Hyphomicrobiaceae bacterium]|nr:hypothetical protein [Hyphomicrobiaceae bacterium]
MTMRKSRRQTKESLFLCLFFVLCMRPAKFLTWPNPGLAQPCSATIQVAGAILSPWIDDLIQTRGSPAAAGSKDDFVRVPDLKFWQGAKSRTNQSR